MSPTNRRDFVKLTLGASGTIAFLSASASLGIRSRAVSIPNWRGKRLVIIRLEGGHDGLFAFLPKDHDVIDSLRPNLARRAKDQGIEIYGDWVLNQNLRLLVPLIERDELAFIQYVGYPNPNTSHFKSSEIWETGYLAGESNEKTGWIGRLLDKNRLMIDENPAPVLSVNETPSLFDKGKNKQGFYWQSGESLTWYESKLNHWLAKNEHAEFSLELNNQIKVMRWLNDVCPAPDYPKTDFGQQLAKISRIIQSDKPFKVLHASHPGYDTHLAEDKRLPKLYQDFSKAINLLASDLKQSAHWKDTLIFVYSEFGRTIDENQNNGTDHGTAGLSFLIGSNDLVREYANKRFAKPEFTESTGEIWLKSVVDFRYIYDDITNKWLLV